MTELVRKNLLEGLTAAQLAAYARDNGYIFREEWGKYLSRFSKKRSGREIEVLVPRTKEISDFNARVYDFISAFAEQNSKAVGEVIRGIINSSYQSVRIVANEGSFENTIAFDAAIDLLQNGMALIDSSATVAANGAAVGQIRGRRPEIVRKYLDHVRMGQTEVGSFVVTLLMPISLEPGEFGLPEGEFSSFGNLVSERFRNALDVASKIGSEKANLSDSALIERGLTANFSGALENMLKSNEQIRISIGSEASSQRSASAYTKTFSQESVTRLAEVTKSLKPLRVNRGQIVKGTVTSISESPKRSAGNFSMEAVFNGEDRSVRVDFARSDREKVFRALHDKADVAIEVFGDVVDRGTQLRMENVKSIEVVARGPLT